MATMPTLPPEFLAANKGPQILAIIIVFPCLAAITVFLRLYTRIKIVHNPSYDDFAIFLAMVFSIATSICQGFQVHYGMGRHIQALTMEQGISSLKALFGSMIMYDFGLTLVKVSICVQYLRITVDKHVRRAVWVLFWFACATCVEAFFASVFSCDPVPKFWDDRIPGKCINRSAVWYVNAGISIVQDIWLVVLPIFILRKLQLPKKEKISLVLILGLGGFASLASVFRLHALYVTSTSRDVSWDGPGGATWSAMELDIGIICASLPTLRALLAKHFPRVFHSSISGRGYSNTKRSDRSDTQKQLVRRQADLEAAQSKDITVKDEFDLQSERTSSPVSPTSPVQAV